MKFFELKDFLDEKADLYNHKLFIENDPIQIPHHFTNKQDIEIAAFLTATISWGNRKSIISSAEKILKILDHEPYEFILNSSHSDWNHLEKINIHRTFSGVDLVQFFKNLQKNYKKYNSLEPLFVLKENETNFYHALERFRNEFLGLEPHRCCKHVSSTYKNSSAKRLMMFLRWMVRKDNKGVDFGIWELNQQYLSIPLDVHTGNISRQLKLVKRKQNDWKTVEELDLKIRKFNPNDPAVYDFALFGLGVTKDLEFLK